MTAGTSPLRPRPPAHQDVLTFVLSTAIGGRSSDDCMAPAADLGSAMAVLATARLDLERIAARLLEAAEEDTARAAIARIVGLTRATLDEYVQRLRSHHNGPETAAGS
jgi:hypothetical protein